MAGIQEVTKSQLADPYSLNRQTCQITTRQKEELIESQLVKQTNSSNKQTLRMVKLIKSLPNPQGQVRLG